MHLRWQHVVSLSCLALGMGLYASLHAAAPAAAAEAQSREAAPDFKLKDSFGKEYTLAEFRGRIVVLEWLNQSCPVSKAAHEKRKTQNVYSNYADKGVVWLGIDSTAGATAEGDRVYAARAGLNYPVLLDSDGKVGHAYGAKRTPHLFVIDRDGQLAYSGAIDDQKDKNYVAAALDDLVAKRPVAKPKTDPYGCGIKYAKPQ